MTLMLLTQLVNQIVYISFLSVYTNVMNQQQQWATTLKKAQYESNKLQNTSTDDQDETIRETMKDYSQKLKKACQEKDEKIVKQLLNELIKLRAKQVPILLQRIKAKRGVVTESAQIKAVEKFYKDCQKLIISVSILLR